MPSEKLNLRTDTNFPKMPHLWNTKTYLLTNGHPQRISPHPQVNKFTTKTLAGLPPFCTPSP